MANILPVHGVREEEGVLTNGISSGDIQLLGLVSFTNLFAGVELDLFNILRPRRVRWLVGVDSISLNGLVYLQ